MKKLSTADAAERTLAALATRGLPPTAPNYLSQFREIAADSLPAPDGVAGSTQSENLLFLLGTLMDAVKQASSQLQEEMSVLDAQASELVSPAVSMDPDTADEMFHSLSASVSWLLRQVSVTRRELSRSKTQLADARRELRSARDLSVTDDITGLPNRRGFDFALNHEMARTRRNQQPLSVVILVLDHFRALDDQHGHPVADSVLCHVASIIKAKLRTSDILARHGADEFAAILPETHAEGADIVVARLLDTIKRAPATVGTQTIAITASAGVTQWFPGESPEALMERAAQALHSARRGGGDRVMCAAIPRLAID